MATALLLPPPPPDYAGPEVKAPVCPLVRKEFEAGGRAFEQLLCTFLGIEGEADTDESLAGQRTSSKAKMQQQKKKGLQSVKLTDDELAVDHYEVLELGKLQWNATEDQIKTAYRRLVVETHPDKTQGGDDTAFKAVQKAYEILSDPQKRLAFDSSIDFDDDIPSLKVAPENFYEVFGDAFHRNSRWSTSRNVPMLGDDSTPIEEVEKFYDFWFTFKSWRDFSHVDTHTIEEADCREEKRWMEKENARERAKLQRQENKRIFTLTERAKMLDPRIKRHKEEQVVASDVGLSLSPSLPPSLLPLLPTPPSLCLSVCLSVYLSVPHTQRGAQEAATKEAGAAPTPAFQGDGLQHPPRRDPGTGCKMRDRAGQGAGRHHMDCCPYCTSLVPDGHMPVLYSGGAGG